VEFAGHDNSFSKKNLTRKNLAGKLAQENEGIKGIQRGERIGGFIFFQQMI
jgi:hypothetical protein